MPTGVAIRDVRELLFDAAERILVGSGPSALTSRAVTDTAGCAKGVLHRHFDDFDDFLAAFVLDRSRRLDARTALLRDRVGRGEVVDNLTGALTDLFDSIAVAVVALVTFRDGLRARLRRDLPAGVPVLTEAVDRIGAYLAAERDLGRLRPDTDVEALAPALIGTAHLLFADRTGRRPDPGAVRRAIAAAVGGALAP
ncbi:TetR/AcrR family transcriptional regulator [Nocardiopsis sp. NPDC057823]|uniref:TetR/AcrR family transcriptional regulator n=1 Tax=Nocardiopsis sp. NPDC057823 TaxID=3346256 RepID=UPI00366ED143